MKTKYFLLFLVSITLLSCSRNTVTPEFIKKTQGRYLFSLDETIEVYFDSNELLMKWRGAEKIKPMNLGDNIFFIKEMNEKVRFLKNPEDKLQYICLVPKDKNQSIKYNFRKLKEDENVPSFYLKNKEYNKALNGYLTIKEKDTAQVYVKESTFNSLGYKKLRKKEYIDAIEIFKINIALFPESDNVYDSLGDAYKKSGDTIKAIENYKKSLTIDSGNKKAKKFIEKYDPK